MESYFFSASEIGQILSVVPQRITQLKDSLSIPDDETVIKGKYRFYKPSATKRIFEHRGVNYSGKEIMCFANNKGGVGKSSISVTAAKIMAAAGFKVLLIDADPQANSTSYLYDKNFKNVLCNVVNRDCSLRDAIVAVDENLDLLPSSLENSRADLYLAKTNANPINYFKKQLAELNYNYIVWDLSPSLSMSNFYAILSCDRVVIVSTLKEFSIQGVQMTHNIIEEARASFDYTPKVSILINEYDSRLGNNLSNMNRLASFGIELESVAIKKDNKMDRSQSERVALNKNSIAYKDIASFVFSMTGIQKAQKSIQ